MHASTGKRRSNARLQELSSEETYYVHCGSGYRSTIAASMLKARGFSKLVNVQDKVATILELESQVGELLVRSGNSVTPAACQKP